MEDQAAGSHNGTENGTENGAAGNGAAGNGSGGSRVEREKLLDALGNLGGLGSVATPIEGMLAASHDHRVEALNHFLIAASEMVQATKAMADAAERAVEFGRAWVEGMAEREPDRSAEAGAEPTAAAQGVDLDIEH